MDKVEWIFQYYKGSGLGDLPRKEVPAILEWLDQTCNICNTWTHVARGAGLSSKTW